MSTPEQLAKWREEFESAWPGFYSAKTDGIYDSDGREDQWQGYLRAKQETEQATEIAALKVRLAEAESKIEGAKIAFENIIVAEEKSLSTLLPLAKFGAELANHADGMGALSTVTIWRIAKRVGVLTEDESEYAPNIMETIERLLK